MNIIVFYHIELFELRNKGCISDFFGEPNYVSICPLLVTDCCKPALSFVIYGHFILTDILDHTTPVCLF